MLVVLSGLPGAGKSAVADEVGRLLPATVLPVDPIEAAIWRCGISPSFETGVAAYEVAAVLAQHQLRLGMPVIADAVNSLEVARDMWRQAATDAGVPVRVIEVLCSDPELHRSRLATRVRTIDGFPEPTWDEVCARRSEWQEWQQERLVLDSIDPLADNVDRALAYLRS
ncbi:MAG: ATP-binding protein [Acidimicrobiales bacterium]